MLKLSVASSFLSWLGLFLLFSSHWQSVSALFCPTPESPIPACCPGFSGSDCTLSTSQCWKIVPFVETCNLVMSQAVNITPTPSPIPLVMFGSDSKIGLPHCDRIETTAIVGYEPNNASRNFFYVNTENELSLSRLLSAFCIPIQLPSILQPVSFHDGFTASYSPIERFISQYNVTVRSGLFFKGIVSIYGLPANTSIQYTPPSKFLLECQMPVIRLGNLLLISGASESEGMLLKVNIQETSLRVQASVLLKVLGSTVTAVSLTVNYNTVSAHFHSQILGLFQATITLSGTLTSSFANAAYSVSGTLSTDFFNFATRKVKEAAKRIEQNANEILAPFQQGVKAARATLDVASHGLGSARDGVSKADRELRNVRRHITSTRDRLNRVCSTRSCSSVSVPYPCGISCSWRRGCGVKTCHKRVTDPVCQAANAACRVLKAPILATLHAVEASLRGFEEALVGAQSVLRGAQSVLDEASSALRKTNEELEGAKKNLGKNLNVLSAVLNLGLDNVFAIDKVSIEATLRDASGGHFWAICRMRIVGNSVEHSLHLSLKNPTALVNYAVDYIKNHFTG